MPNRHVTVAAESATSSDGSYLGRILCPHCMCSHAIEAEGGCSSEACDDCGSPSENE